MSQIDDIQKRLSAMFSAPLAEECARRVVFWRDERGEFAANVDDLQLPGVKTLKLDGHNSFIAKKRLLRDDPASSYLIYDPLTYDGPQDDWLLDIRLMSEEFNADKAAIIASELGLDGAPDMRQAVRDHLAFFDAQERRKSFKALRSEYQGAAQITTGIVAVLAGASRYELADIIVSAFESGLEAMQKYDVADKFWALVCNTTGFDLAAHGEDLSALRKHLFISALAGAVGAEILDGLEAWFDEKCLAQCTSIVDAWLSGEKGDALFDVMRNIEDELRLGSRYAEMDIETMMRSEIFPCAHEALLKRIFNDAADHNVRVDLISSAVEHVRTSRWHERYKEYYECAKRIAEIKSFEDRFMDGFHLTDQKKVFELYCSTAYKMDTAYRKFHLAFGKTLTDGIDRLDDDLKRAEREFVEPVYKDRFLRELNACWTNAAREALKADGSVADIGTARRFYALYPASDKTAHSVVIISDALRYEVAAELCAILAEANIGSVKIDGVQSIFPSITEFGMAAQLPGEELSWVKPGDVRVDGMPTRSIDDRAKVLAAANASSTAIKYNDLKNANREGRRELIRDKTIVYIYHNTIDDAGDKAASEDKVFQACEDAIRELADLVKIIVNQMNRTNVYITADHGFLYTYRALEESDKISKETIKGEILDYGRRYIIASKDAEAPYMASIRMDDISSAAELRGFAPLETTRIKKPGAGDRYVHGGVSLQEFVVPVITFNHIRRDYKNYVETQSPGIELLAPATRRITNMSFSLKLMQKRAVGGSVRECSYAVCMKDSSGNEVSDSKTLIADRTNENASERTFMLRFALKPGKYDKERSYALYISSEKDSEIKIPFVIDIPMGDDYGFDL